MASDLCHHGGSQENKERGHRVKIGATTGADRTGDAEARPGSRPYRLIIRCKRHCFIFLVFHADGALGRVSRFPFKETVFNQISYALWKWGAAGKRLNAFAIFHRVCWEGTGGTWGELWGVRRGNTGLSCYLNHSTESVLCWWKVRIYTETMT